MSKLFKKSLAFCVAIAMVFTLFAGTISVNAEDAEETLTVTLEVTNTPVEEGAPQVTFPLAVTCSGDTSINVLCLVITTTAGKVSSVVSKEATEDYTIHYNGDRALLNAGQTVEDLGGFNAAELLVTVDLNEGLDKEAYDITIDCRSENASDANENALKISYETGYIRLLAHTHELSETYESDDNGHWQVCTSKYCDVVGGYTTEVAEHVWENDGEAVAPDCVDTLEQPVICNICGATKTVNVDPVGHDYEYTNDGETHSAVCNNNPAHVITGEAHTYVEGKCVCGAVEVTGPTPDSTLSNVIRTKVLNVQDSLGIKFGLLISPSAYDYDEIEFRVSKKELDATYMYTGETLTKVFKKADSADKTYQAAGVYYFVYSDAALYESQLELTCSIHLFKDGVETVYCDLDSVTLYEFAKSEYDAYEGKRKILYAALTLATKAQEHFAAIGAAGNVMQQLLDENGAPNVGLDSQYATTYTTLNKVDLTGNSTEFFEPGMRITKSPGLKYQVLLTNYKNMASQLNAEIKYYSLAQGKEMIKTFNFADEGAAILDFAAAGAYIFNFDDAALYDIDKEITCTITNNEGTVIATHKYSIETGLAGAVDETGTAGEVYRAIANFLSAAKEYEPWASYFA